MENDFDRVIEKFNMLRQINKVEFQPVSEEIVTGFENRWNIILPENYRRLLLSVGYVKLLNDGYSLLLSLDEVVEDAVSYFSDTPIPNDLFSAPFPFTTAWLGKDKFDDEADYLEQVRQKIGTVRGALTLCSGGCTTRYILVVSGTERGNVWWDDRWDCFSVAPEPFTPQGSDEHDRAIPIEPGNRVTFYQWIEGYVDHWLAS
ncbi:MAG TPA: hypothetical protein PLD47_02505 [Aggregatilineales bacterium]|nr:SMI1/KNR4 family protein [Anaerolineales bacterium]HRE46571.1 hypothetical protein [Aggregatilineales bacterium]